MADWILLPLLCRPEAAPLRELAGADAAAVTVSDAPWRVEVHNGYDFAPAERVTEERAEETAPRAAAGHGGAGVALSLRTGNDAQRQADRDATQGPRA